MKRISSIFLLVLMVFGIGGCNKAIEGKNEYSMQYKEVRIKEDVIYNLNNVVKEVKAISFNGNVSVKDKNFSLKGEIILNETISDSIVKISVGNLTLYFKDNMVYLCYVHNKTNIIVKDSLETFVDEIVNSLNLKGIKCNEDKIMNFINAANIRNVNFNYLLKYISEDDLSFIKFKNSTIRLNDQYLPEKVTFANKKVNVDVIFDYSNISVSIPVKYDLFTLKIRDVKKLLKIDYISDLID